MNKSIFKVLVIALCIFGIDGCKPETKPNPLQVFCTLSNPSPVPMQVVLVDCSEEVFIDSFYSADLSGSPLKLIKVSTKQLAFLIPPETVTGEKVLKFALPAGEISLGLSISAPTVILTVPDIIVSIDNTLDKIKTLQANANILIQSGKYDKTDLDYLNKLDDSLLVYKSKFSNATPEVQQYALLYMAANQQSLTNLNTIANSYNDLGLNKKGYSDMLFDFGGTLVVPTIIGCITAVLVPPAAVASLGVASAIGLGAIIGWSIEKTQALGALSKIKELITVADNKTEIPSDVTLAVKEFEANVEASVVTNITYRTIMDKDETSTSKVLSGYVKNFKTLRTEWSRNVRNSLGDLKDFVNKSVVGNPKTTGQIKVEIVDQPDATLEVKGTPDNFTLLFKLLNKQLQDLNIRITYLEQNFEEVKKMLGIKISVSNKELLFRDGWKVIDATCTTTRGTIFIDETINSRYTLYSSCNNNTEFYQLETYFCSGGMGLSLTKSINDILSLNFNAAYFYYKSVKLDCSVFEEKKHEIAYTKPLGSFNAINFNSTSKTYMGLYNEQLKIIKISSSFATLEMKRQPFIDIPIYQTFTLLLEYKP